MYDAWAVYDETAETYLLGKNVDGFPCSFNGVDMPSDVEAAKEEAISYATYRILSHRFQSSPRAATTLPAINTLFAELGYDSGYTSTDYSTNIPAALGNYIAECIINFGYQDGYRDASDQCSLSHIWGGIHPPVDDIPGRLIGEKIGLDAFLLAESHFYKDVDQGGYYNYIDCNDSNAMVNPGMAEICDDLDNDCNSIMKG